MNKAGRRMFSYPQNLVYDISHFNNRPNIDIRDPEDEEYDNISEIIETNLLNKSQLKGLDFAYAQLSDEERLLIKMRYEEKRLISECAKELGISTSGTRMKIEYVIRKLRFPGIRKYITMGYDFMSKLLTIDNLDIPVSNLNLPVGPFNVINRNLYTRTIRELVDTIENRMRKFYTIRCMGRSTAQIIFEELHRHGMLRFSVEHYLEEFDKY